MRLRHHRQLLDGPVARALLTLQRRAYAVEAELLGDDRIPPLHESLSDVLAAGLRWWVADDDGGRLLGAVGYTAGDPVDIDRLVVDPAVFRRGVGRALIATVVSEAAGRPITVSTGAANDPARRLYEAAGFRFVGESEPVPGLRVSHFRYPGSPMSTIAATGPPPSGP